MATSDVKQMVELVRRGVLFLFANMRWKPQRPFSQRGEAGLHDGANRHREVAGMDRTGVTRLSTSRLLAARFRPVAPRAKDRAAGFLPCADAQIRRRERFGPVRSTVATMAVARCDPRIDAAM